MSHPVLLLWKTWIWCYYYPPHPKADFWGDWVLKHLSSLSNLTHKVEKQELKLRWFGSKSCFLIQKIERAILLLFGGKFTLSKFFKSFDGGHIGVWGSTSLCFRVQCSCIIPVTSVSAPHHLGQSAGSPLHYSPTHPPSSATSVLFSV